MDLATQYNWILTPFQINFQGLTVNFAGERLKIWEALVNKQLKRLLWPVAISKCIKYPEIEKKYWLMSSRHQARPTHYAATHVLTLLIENWWHIQSALSLGTHTGALAHLLSESGISIVCQRGLFSWYHDAHCSTSNKTNTNRKRERVAELFMHLHNWYPSPSIQPPLRITHKALA